MKTVQKVAVASLVAGTATAAGDAHAAFDAYLKIDGIKGGTTIKGEANVIPITSFELSGNAAEDIGATGATGGVASGKRTFSPVVIQKLVDATSVDLFKAFTGGQHLATVEIDFVNTAVEGGAPYLKFDLGDAFVTSYSVSGSGSERPTESISFSFLKIEETYITTVKGEVGDTASASYDLSTLKAD